MSKELEAVKFARIEFEKNLEDDPNNEWLKRRITGLKMAEQSLQRLEAIDSANPSEALNCLDKMAKQIELDEDTDFWEIRNAHKTVEQALLKAQEQEELLGYITRFIDGVEISDKDVCYVPFKNHTPYLDCIEMDKDHYNKFKKYMQK